MAFIPHRMLASSKPRPLAPQMFSQSLGVMLPPESTRHSPLPQEHRVPAHQLLVPGPSMPKAQQPWGLATSPHQPPPAPMTEGPPRSVLIPTDPLQPMSKAHTWSAPGVLTWSPQPCSQHGPYPHLLHLKVSWTLGPCRKRPGLAPGRLLASGRKPWGQLLCSCRVGSGSLPRCSEAVLSRLHMLVPNVPEAVPALW